MLRVSMLKKLKLSILRQCIESLTMVSAKRIESFDFATNV